MGFLVELEVTVTHPVRNQDSIGVNLDGPISEFPTPNPVHSCPDIHEESCVACGAIDAPTDSSTCEVVRVDRPKRTIAKPSLAITCKYVILLAGKDTHSTIFRRLEPGNVSLIGIYPNDVEAIQGWIRPSTWGARAKCFARPWIFALVTCLRMARVAATHAAGPFLILLVALKRLTRAAHCLAAVGTSLAALVLHPPCWAPMTVLLGNAWRARTQLLARPDAVFLVKKQGAGSALWHAHCPLVILGIACLARELAALCCRAIL